MTYTHPPYLNGDIKCRLHFRYQNAGAISGKGAHHIHVKMGLKCQGIM